jgi:hypothetical protein
MTKPTIKLVNAETGEEVTREMNAEELKQLEIDKAKALSDDSAESQKFNDKDALLKKLGITADEAALLLG